MAKDFRLALRTLFKAPAFALTTIAVLALGTGSNTAIFSLVDQILLNPQGVATPERIVAVRVVYEKLALSSIPISAPDFRDVESGTKVFESAAVMQEGDYNYTAGDVPERLKGANVSLRWFDVFGASPQLGRTFREAEDQPKANNVAVLAHAAWMRMFGGDVSVIGRTISLNQKPYKIVGVMKRDFRWPKQVDLWVPIGLPAADFNDGYRFNERLTAVARLRPGVSLEQAAAFVRLAADRVRSRATEDGVFARDSRWGMFVVPFTDFTATDTKAPMLVLMGAVAFVLLVACANVAGLMVARTAGRSRDIAVRAALGASGWRLLRQTMAESLVLAFAGAGIGVGLARAGIQALLAVAPEQAVVGLHARIDGRVLGFTLLVAALTAVLSAAAPAWHALRLSPFEHIKSAGRSATSGRARQRLRAALVVSETALALVLLVGAGLLLRSFARLQEVNPGFEPRRVTAAVVSLPPASYGDAARQVAFYRAVDERMKASPGVASAAFGVPLPFSGSGASASFSIEGRVPRSGDPGPHGNIRSVTPGYFATLGIPVRAGRVFTDFDRADTTPVVVIDENLARQYWPGENPLGRRLRNGNDMPWATIVGIVGHVKHSDLASDPGKGTYYYSLFQRPLPFAFPVVKTMAEAATAAPIIREAVRAVDSAQPVHTIKSMSDMVAASLGPRRFVMQLLGFFAAVALAMAALGLYGVISYMVTQRTAEIGVRLAFGAPRRTVLWMVVRQGLGLAVAGVVLGVLGAVASSQLLSSQLYGVRPFDPLTLVATTAALLGAALLASYIPARRATRVDPLVALRAE